jgi:hypothetical protein
MLQHSRIRATYNIDGTTADDCCSAYACPNCTLMQDDREIRAREYKEGKNDNKSGTVNHQPRVGPDMQYASLNFFGDEPVQHRESLVRTNATTVETGQSQSSRNHGTKLETQHKLEHSKRYHEHKKLEKDSRIEGDEHKTKEEGKMAYNNHEPGASNNGRADNNQPANQDLEDRDAILASRQTWRNQNMSGKQEGPLDQMLAACPGDGARGSENQDPVTNRRALFDYSEDASMSQVRGKRALKQLAKAEGNTTWATAGNASESLADERVLVFYDDGEYPQRHRLADCARFRASTLGRTDTPHHNDLPAGWREEKIVGGDDQSKASEPHHLAACPEVVVTEHLNQQHILNDCAAENTNKAADIKQHHCLSHSLDNCSCDKANNVSDAEKHQGLPHSLKDCTDDVTTITKELAEPKTSNSEPIQQHCLDDCSTEITSSANSKPAEGISQHHLAECTEKIPDFGLMATALPDQHVNAGCAVTVNTQISEPSNLDQHGLTDCAIISVAQSSEASDDIYSGPKLCSHNGHNHSRSNLENGQNENHTITITVPQPPVIIVTTSDVLEEAIGEQHDQSRSKSPEIISISNESQTSTEHKAGPSNSTRDHDGPTDAKDGQQQLAEAAAALSKALRAAADARHGKTTTEFEGDDPTVVDADGSAKKLSHRSRSKTIGGRAQKSKGKL